MHLQAPLADVLRRSVGVAAVGEPNKSKPAVGVLDLLGNQKGLWAVHVPDLPVSEQGEQMQHVP